ncbi:hypothetical protein [Micromonospora sagamiensis]|uniref:Uncharacterized protein n=1 Tax=Micromonospora sagamiensis TaxID=47875 RepID=A0A562W982_9ACTN|nr:hypothetical protein [Micromonospora sagamiensis]TWJ26820.1 hypothetical protein JD81_00302 [Micromonospora sagamiensis]BCL14293.1 hypothetical protein GCM10017556_20320 [Micromonospora sagamiensis]
MAAGWYAHRPALVLTATALAGALAGWLARSRVAHRGTGAPTVAPPPGSTGTRPTVARPTESEPGAPEPTVARPTGSESGAPEPSGARPARTGPTRGPSPMTEPVPFPEGAAVDAPYTAEEPYSGRPRYSPAARPRRTDVPGGTPP